MEEAEVVNTEEEGAVANLTKDGSINPFTVQKVNEQPQTHHSGKYDPNRSHHFNK